MKTFLRLIIYVCLASATAHAQCGPATPVFTVNLAGNPGGTWISPNVVRNDVCCGTTAPNKCVEFVITLDSNAVGINFSIASGAIPGGALFYQVNCSPPQAVGAPICLSGPGPHVLTFCKPGNNNNTYQITSIPAPVAGNDITINQGCSGVLSVTGFSASTVSWTSIFPGAPGAYNSYLSCASGCTTTAVTGNTSSPPYVDYKVCGTPSAPCFQSSTICDTVRVYFHPTLVANILPSNPTVCFGQTSASLTVVGSGGTPAYTYTWSNGATTQTITAGAGPYTVLLGDASGCPPVSANVTVTSFSVPITANAGADKVVCKQSPAATISGTVTGASGGLWAGGQGTFTPSNTTLSNVTYIPTSAELSAGSVNLVLSTTGNGGCPGTSDTMKITYQGFSGTIAITNTNVSCYGGSNGVATASITSGSTPYTYAWNTVPSQTTATAGNLAAGNYTLTATDNIGCTAVASVLITQPTPLNQSAVIQNASCFGAANGSISVTATGGTPAYTYSWSPAPGSGPALTGLAAGTYSLLIKDANNCALTQTFAVTQPSVIAIAYTTTPVSCFNGSNASVQTSVTGGTGAYSYSWSPSGGNAPTASGLTAGVYSLQVSDANGCPASATVSVTQPPLLQVSTTSTNETCDYLNNGTAQATASGGTPAYTYTWQPLNVSGSSVSGLPSGAYTLTAQDAKGCITATVVSITQPPVLSLVAVNISNVSCFGGNNGSINVSASGGTPSYTYSWQPVAGTGPTVSGLAAGSYTAYATDSHGCNASFTLAVTQPLAALTASASSTAVSCNGGSNGNLSSLASGGTVPYTFAWSPLGISGQNVSNVQAGNYSVLITDAHGCTASASTVVAQPSAIGLTLSEVNSTCSSANGQASVSASGGTPPYLYQWSPIGGTGTVASNLPAGSYNVTVTDNRGCVATGGILVNDNAGPNASIISKTDVSCFGGNNGSATVGTSGGTGPFTYQWQPIGGTGPTATGLSAGIYTVTVIDANGCQSLATTSPAILEPPALLISLFKTDVSCFGGSNGVATATVSGGVPGYTYTWSPAASSTATLSNVSAGSYTLAVTDANGCSSSQQISVNEPPVLSVSISSVTAVSCYGGNSGAAYSTVSGGTAPYFYSWSSGSSAPGATGLAAGNYTVSITDSKGCTASSSTLITQPSQALSIAMTSTMVLCFGGSNGIASAAPSGGTPGYTYSWSPTPGSSQTIVNASAGLQLVTVTDSKGCVAYGSVVVAQPAAISATIVTTNATCGNANGMLSALTSGGSSPYTYTWSPSGANTYSLSGLNAGSYSVSINDAKGCSASYSGNVVNIAGPVLSAAGASPVSCYGGANGTATVSPSGGTTPFQYNWQPYGGTGAVATGLIAGTYTCTISDVNNCVSSTILSVSQPSQLGLLVAGQSQPGCYGGQNGSMTVTSTGGVSPYTYTWSPAGGNSSTANGLASTLYTITTGDSHGCLATITASLSQPSQLQASVASFTNPTCYNGSNGSVSTIVSGGTAPYQFNWLTSPTQTANVATGLSQGSYSVIITDNHGCTVTASANLTQPSQVITSAGGNDTICLGQSAVITASASGGAGNYFYSWSSLPGNSSSQTVSPASSTNYTVSAFDQNGCAFAPAVIHVEVYSLTAGNVQAFANSPICPGNGTLVYAVVSGNSGPVTYSWNNNLGNTAGGYWVVPTQPTAYIVTVSNTCGTSIQDTAMVTFNPPPTVVLVADTLSGCVPLVIHFNDSSVSGNPADPVNGWSWSFGDGSTSTLQNPAHTYTNSGTYNVVLTVTTNQGCTNNNGSAPFTVTVHPKPVAAFYVNSTQLNIPFDHLICSNQSTGAVSYSWTFGDGGTSTLANPNYLYTINGSFPVDLVATNQYGCSDTAEIRITTTSDIIIPTAFTPNGEAAPGGYYNGNSLDNDIFFPYTSGVTEFHMNIFNRWGELIFESTDLKYGWDGYYHGKLSPQGVYVWKIDLKWNNGKTFNKVGDVTLLR